MTTLETLSGTLLLTRSRPRSGLIASKKLATALLLALGIPLMAAAPAHADTRIAVNGAKPGALLNSITGGSNQSLAQWQANELNIGAKWAPASTLVGIDYPATAGPLGGLSALSANQSIATGQQTLNTAIMAQNGQRTVVVGLSMGSMVLDAEERYLATDPNSPTPGSLTFIEFSDPNRGISSLFPVGTYIPFFGLTVPNIPVSQYNTVVVFAQYDGWANPPDRPWNVVADLNAVMGAVYVQPSTGFTIHSQTAFSAPANAVLEYTATNARGGTTTTYMVPTQQLPLTQPLLQMGVPAQWVNKIDNTLRPIVNRGYSALTPNAGPYISQGKLVFPKSQPSPPKPLAAHGERNNEPSPDVRPLRVGRPAAVNEFAPHEVFLADRTRHAYGASAIPGGVASRLARLARSSITRPRRPRVHDHGTQ